MKYGGNGVCMVPKWEILKSIYTIVANSILSKVRNFNSIVVGRDNSKLQNLVHNSCTLIDNILT